MFDVIAFDADDTLWHTEPLYRDAEQKYLQALAAVGVTAEQALAVLHRVEVENLPAFGYGIRGFTLSMIEAAAEASAGRVGAETLAGLVQTGREMTTQAVSLLDGVEETLRGLAGRNLWVITKGDVLDQESKIRRSGLAQYFQHAEIVIDKTPQIYAGLLEKYQLDPQRFLMVGNSLRSDINPVLSLGAHAVYVPYPLTWAHESADLPADTTRYYEIANLSQLPGLLEKIEARA
jgi:putative hydrolase of the HAD superfamily